MKNPICSALALALAVTAVLPTPPAAAELGDGKAAKLSLVLSSTKLAETAASEEVGPTGGLASSSNELAPGETLAAHLAAGRFIRGGHTRCAHGSAGWRPSWGEPRWPSADEPRPDPTLPPGERPFWLGRPGAPSFVWRVEATLRDAELDRFTVDLRWMRYEGQAVGEPEAVVEVVETVSLAHGQRRLLDHQLLGATKPDAEMDESCKSERLTVELQAELPGSNGHDVLGPDLELWLVRRPVDGAERSLRIELPGRPAGELSSFRFPPLDIAVAGVRHRGERFFVGLQGEGRIRAWPQASGEILLVVEAVLSAALGEAAAMSSGAGTKRFTTFPGEAVKLVLPPTYGRIGTRRDGFEFQGDPPAGVEVGPNGVTFDLHELLGEQEIELVVRPSS